MEQILSGFQLLCLTFLFIPMLSSIFSEVNARLGNNGSASVTDAGRE